jgi:quercetin dioxygenase-like cupin family protein
LAQVLGEDARERAIFKCETKNFLVSVFRMRGAKSLYFPDSSTAPKIKQMAGLETRLLTGLSGEKMMMVFNVTSPHCTVPFHSHPHEQVGMVYSGEAKLTIGNETRIVHKGDFYCIPSNVPHSDTCIGNKPFIMLDIFYPVRDDFKAKLASAT